MSTGLPKRALQMVVIYDRPKDYPSHVVTRRWNVGADGRLTPSAACDLHGTIEEARTGIRRAWPGLVMISRSPGDDPCIVETWL